MSTTIKIEQGKDEHVNVWQNPMVHTEKRAKSRACLCLRACIGLWILIFVIVAAFITIHYTWIPKTTNFKTQLTYVKDSEPYPTIVEMITNRQQALENGDIIQVETTINDVNELEDESEMTLENNGFEFYSVPTAQRQEFIDVLSQTSTLQTQFNIFELPSMKKRFTKQAQQILVEFARNKDSLNGLNIHCYGAQHRHSWLGLFPAASPFRMVHIDFPEQDFVNITLPDAATSLPIPGVLVYDKLDWIYPQVDQRQWNELRSKFKQAVNVWIPLMKVRSHPLVFMDIHAFNPANKVDLVQAPGLAIKVCGVKRNQLDGEGTVEPEWYWKSQMDIGDVVIFDTLKTPHSAGKIPWTNWIQRESVEARCIFTDQ
eukprot:282576_1